MAVMWAGMLERIQDFDFPWFPVAVGGVGKGRRWGRRRELVSGVCGSSSRWEVTEEMAVTVDKLTPASRASERISSEPGVWELSDGVMR
jgi:hypothetical protein